MAKILIIDDVSSIRMFLESVLAKAGHDVRTAHNGRKGLEALRHEAFDLLITDLYMPEADGLEMLCTARAENRLPRTIAISSGHEIMDLLPTARFLGANATLRKPIDGAALLQTVAKVLAAPPAEAPGTTAPPPGPEPAT